MAALSNADRREVWAQWMRAETATVGISKADLRAAIDAADAWIDANGAAYNAAIPQPARGTLSASQKARILAAVILKRFERGA